MSKTGRFAPDFMIMQRRKEEEHRRVYDEKVKTDSTIGRVAHWEHKTADKCGCPRPPAPARPRPRACGCVPAGCARAGGDVHRPAVLLCGAACASCRCTCAPQGSSCRRWLQAGRPVAAASPLILSHLAPPPPRGHG